MSSRPRYSSVAISSLWRTEESMASTSDPTSTQERETETATRILVTFRSYRSRHGALRGDRAITERGAFSAYTNDADVLSGSHSCDLESAISNLLSIGKV